MTLPEPRSASVVEASAVAYGGLCQGTVLDLKSKYYMYPDYWTG